MDEECETWRAVGVELTALERLQRENEEISKKFERIHSKLAKQGEERTFNLKEANRLLEIYNEAYLKTAEEQSVISKAIERLDILAALKVATETGVDVKRKKRKLDEKPKVRSSSSIPLAKRTRTMEDVPKTRLQVGDKVAIRPQKNNFHILAIIIKYLAETNKYEVEDAEDDENDPQGERKRYIFPPKAIIPIPKEARDTEFPEGRTVIALFPQTSCFYKAVVKCSPSKNKVMPGHYILHFEDDGGFDRHIQPEWVLEMPPN
ncbi:SGF29 tudor-like domain-containing protein [Cladochytrium replicatum]|nr:SGF29 tudor-like domain-containing protein [Cladochytrium replicatum]